MSGQELKVVGTQRQKLKEKPRRNASSWLVPYSLLSLLSYNIQDHLTIVGTACSHQGPPTSITIKESTSLTYQQASLMEV